MNPRFEPITGRYLHLELLGKPHPALRRGSGTRHPAPMPAHQFRGLMNDQRVKANFRVIAFDMPWHGKSSPPSGWQDTDYQLTSRDYCL